MARKKKHEEHENHERWLVSYADFITLLFAFFVVMYAVSSVNEGKYRVLSDALLAAFRSPQKTLLPVQVGNPAKSPNADLMNGRQSPAVVRPKDLPIPETKRRKSVAGGAADPLSEIADKVEEQLSRLIDEDLIAVRHNDDFVEIEIKSKILFEPGGIEMTTKAKQVVIQLAEILRNFYNFIRVEGYTDTTPIKSTVYPSNWELSAARAAVVVRTFADNGVRPGQMAAMGYAQYQPVADNETEEGRNKNRRVSIIVMNQIDHAGLREELNVFGDQGADPSAMPKPKGWEPPVDVTSRPVTEQADVDIRPMMRLPRPIEIEVAPAITIEKGSGN